MHSTTLPEARQLAKEAYIYGYPLVLMEMTRRVMTNVSAPEPMTRRSPLGQFVHVNTLPTPQSRRASFPNCDTLASLAWLDLSTGPMVLHLPNTYGRYFLMPIFDAWTDVIAVLGKRTTGTHAADYAIVPSGWTDPLPVALKVISAPTDLVQITGLTRVNGPADVTAAGSIQLGYHLKPLSAWGRIYTPPRVHVDPTVDDPVPPVDQVARMDAATYFRTLATTLHTNPPHSADEAMLPVLARLGILASQRFDFAALSSIAKQALQDAVPLAQEDIKAESCRLGEEVNGWVSRLGPGRYGTDYVRRAAIAWSGLGATLGADALSFSTETDGADRQLNGAYEYLLHFAPHRTPPVNGFWSLTMYGPDRCLVENVIDRYAIGNRDALRFNSDGSLDIFMQHDPPSEERLANWLPAPSGSFSLVLRMYWPKPDVFNRAWAPPAIQPVHAEPHLLEYPIYSPSPAG